MLPHESSGTRKAGPQPGPALSAEVSRHRRAVDELADQNYWGIDASSSGGANEYFIIHPDERVELWLEEERDHRKEWLDAERDHQRLCHRWLGAEKQFVQKWLEAENQFAAEWLLAELDARDEYQRKVFDAVYDRCEDSEHATAAAELAWEDHQAGKLPLADALQAIADTPQEAFPEPDQSVEMSRPLLNDEQTPAHRRADPCSTLSNPLLIPDVPTSANDHSHKSFKSLKTYKDSKGEHAPRALDARSAGPPKEEPDCFLCDGAGTFVDGDDYPIVLLSEEGDDECQVECQHSMAGNLAEIRRIESESEGYWQIARTGYREIDSHYKYLDDPYPSDTDPWKEDDQ